MKASLKQELQVVQGESLTVVRLSCIIEIQLEIFGGLPSNLEILDDLSMHLLALRRLRFHVRSEIFLFLVELEIN